MNQNAQKYAQIQVQNKTMDEYKMNKRKTKA